MVQKMTVVARMSRDVISFNFTGLTDIHARMFDTTVLGAFTKIRKNECWFRHVCPSSWDNSSPTGRIFMKFDVCEFFGSCRESSGFIKM
jgi:hypothetical protein